MPCTPVTILGVTVRLEYRPWCMQIISLWYNFWVVATLVFATMLTDYQLALSGDHEGRPYEYRYPTGGGRATTRVAPTGTYPCKGHEGCLYGVIRVCRLTSWWPEWRYPVHDAGGRCRSIDCATRPRLRWRPYGFPTGHSVRYGRRRYPPIH